MARETKFDPIPLIIFGGVLFFLFRKKQTGLPVTAGPGTIEMKSPSLKDVLAKQSRLTGERDYIRWVQESLNLLIGEKLAVDGIYGAATKEAVRRFQSMWQITTDGIVGPETDYAIKSALGVPGYTEQPYTGYPQSGLVYENWY